MQCWHAAAEHEGCTMHRHHTCNKRTCCCRCRLLLLLRRRRLCKCLLLFLQQLHQLVIVVHCSPKSGRGMKTSKTSAAANGGSCALRNCPHAGMFRRPPWHAAWPLLHCERPCRRPLLLNARTHLRLRPAQARERALPPLAPPAGPAARRQALHGINAFLFSKPCFTAWRFTAWQTKAAS